MLNTNIGQALALPSTCTVSGKVKGSWKKWQEHGFEGIHRAKKMWMKPYACFMYNLWSLCCLKTTKKITFVNGALKNPLGSSIQSAFTVYMWQTWWHNGYRTTHKCRKNCNKRKYCYQTKLQASMHVYVTGSNEVAHNTLPHIHNVPD